jgi:hypothetical protein
MVYVKQNLRLLIFYVKHAFTHNNFPQEIRIYLLSIIFECYTCV